jgi:pyruvate formate lyase activating enzyme
MEALGVCGDCLLESFDQALPLVEAAHACSRQLFSLPERPPSTDHGAACPICARACLIGPGELGFCGMRTAVASASGQARLQHLAGRPSGGLLQWYRDPLPTNCVADWVCSGHRQRGRHNLAVFYSSCTFNCLYCQNWHFRRIDPASSDGISAVELADCANRETYCVCYFGGDPASQMPHALASARLLAERGVTICWETAGTQHVKLFDEAVRLSLASGGTVKIDLKAFDSGLHEALTGAGNCRTLANFERAANRAAERPELPLVIASTLLVPGYVTAAEVGRIARFIAGIDPATPYALLAFAPQFAAADLPTTSAAHARAALEAACEAGLTNVRIGNQHLL